jgi:hypothetical protein
MQMALLTFEHSKIDLFVPNKWCSINVCSMHLHHKLQYLHAIIYALREDIS